MLTVEQERDLFERVDVGIYAEHQLSEGLVAKDEVKDYRWLVSDGERAAIHLLKTFAPLVEKLARSSRLSSAVMDQLDLTQVAYIALYHSIFLYDRHQNTRFASYAVTVVKREIAHAKHEFTGHTMLSKTQTFQLRKTIALKKQKGATDEEIADHLGVRNGKAVARLLAADAFVESLNQPVASDDGHVRELGDLVEGDVNQARQDVEEIHRILRELLDALPDDLGLMVNLYYGLDQAALPVSQIAELYGLTPRQVHEKLRQAMMMLKSPSRLHFVARAVHDVSDVTQFLEKYL